jgi:hypothetical protein
MEHGTGGGYRALASTLTSTRGDGTAAYEELERALHAARDPPTRLVAAFPIGRHGAPPR